VPDVIYDRGDVGKEAMIRVLGADALDVAGKVLRLAEELQGKADTPQRGPYGAR